MAPNKPSVVSSSPSPTVLRVAPNHVTHSADVSRSSVEEKFTVAEFAEMLGLPVVAINAIIAKNRTAIKRPFYNISQLAGRWGCSRAQVYITSCAKLNSRCSIPPAKTVKVRRQNSRKHKDTFTGSVTYQTFGSLDSNPFRLSLGAEEDSTAKRRTAKIERAVLEGVTSPLWAELADSLPPTTFKSFANHFGYSGQSRKATAKLTWQDLCDAYEIEMQRKVDNKERGATRNEGIMSASTRDRYRITVRDFTDFLEDRNTPLVDITPATIAKYKVVRHKAVVAKRQSRGGAGVALDIAILHGVFAFAVAQKMLADKPISMARESKPGKNPKNGRRLVRQRLDFSETIENIEKMAGEPVSRILRTLSCFQ
jgi:hypothetical protein